MISGFLSVDQIAHSGVTLALGAVVTVQYLYYVWRMSQARRLKNSAEDERRAAIDELDASKRRYSLSRLENQILHEFVTQVQPEKAIDLLLRRFVPKPDEGFAAFIEKPSEGAACAFSRGLSPESIDSLRLTDDGFDRVFRNRLVTVEGSSIAEGSLIVGLARYDAVKAARLHLVALGPADEPLGVFAATSLYPSGAPHGQQAELVKRLMTSLAASLNLANALQTRETQLRLATAKLDLRAIADQRYGNPMGLVDAFLRVLRPKVAAESAALFLYRDGRADSPAVLTRCGGPKSAGLSAQWKFSEELSVRRLAIVNKPYVLGHDEITASGFSPVRAALLVPLFRDGTAIGTICLSRGEPVPFTSDEQSLAAWAAEYLAQVFPRVLGQAVIERQARQDGLTGLANRRELDARFATALEQARRAGSEVSLLFCDLDRFKAINDDFGHRAGDEVLRMAANAIQDVVQRTRSSDQALAARYGGEELAVLLPAFPPAGALRIAEAIRTAVERSTVSIDGNTVRATISIGHATFPRHGDSPEALIARADRALYCAKSAGRNRVFGADDVPVRVVTGVIARP